MPEDAPMMTAVRVEYLFMSTRNGLPKRAVWPWANGNASDSAVISGAKDSSLMY